MKKIKISKLWLLALIVPMLFLVACDSDDDTDVDDTPETTEVADDAENGDEAEAINPITVAEIEAAQVAWGEGLVSISTAFNDGEDYVSIAVAVLEDLYGYEYGPVLFKPTIASDVPFRFDWDGAASYFIGTSAPQTIDEDAAGF
ncbi:MAG: hypothetical protein FWE07_09070, partial [Turicibacter sp.]|nr:hypothetical protein [Turicibacter sp.]